MNNKQLLSQKQSMLIDDANNREERRKYGKRSNFKLSAKLPKRKK